MEPIKIYASRSKAWKSSWVAALFVVAALGSFNRTNPDVFLGSIFVGFAVIFVWALARTLVFNTPMYVLDHKELFIRRIFRDQRIPWSTISKISVGNFKKYPCLNLQVGAKTVRVLAVSVDGSLEDLIQKMNAVPEFAALYGKTVEAMKASGEFAALAERMKKSAKPASGLQRFGLVVARIAVIFAVAFVFGLIQRRAKESPDNLIKMMKEKTAQTDCGKFANILSDCFGVSRPECLQTLQSAMDECGVETKQKFSGHHNPKKFVDAMALCSYKKYFAKYDSQIQQTEFCLGNRANLRARAEVEP